MSLPVRELVIERLATDGDGVALLDGRTVFVPGTFPGERVRVQIASSGTVLRADQVELLEPSSARRAANCALAGRCGGCDWLSLSEEAQRAAKQEQVLSALEHVGGLPRDAYEHGPLRAVGPVMGYRRRAVLHPASGGLGFFGRRSHECVRVMHCPALVPALAHLPEALGQVLGASLKDISTATLLEEGGARALSFALLGAPRPRLVTVAEKLVAEYGLSGVVMVHPERSRGAPPRVIGDPALPSPCPLRRDVRLFLRPDAFTQANAPVTTELVGAAVAALELDSVQRVLELYCGNGNFTFALAARARQVLAVEEAGVSLELARRSAREARVGNVRFVQGEALKVCTGLAKEGATFEGMLVDPPRTGAKGLGRHAAALGVRRLVYVACDPTSLARDAKGLVEAGFAPRWLQLFDMFPQTHHVEAVMAFDRGGR